MTFDKDQLRKTAELQKLMRDPAAVLALIAERDQIKAENEALRKDAERYRWLLQNWFTMSSEYMGVVSFQTGRSRWSDLPDEAVSEAIDAAMGKGEQS